MVANVRQPEILPNPTAGSSHPKKPGRLTLQLDEIWSFVGAKDNKQWIWLAIDADTREIVGCYVGNRTRQSAKKLWQSLPPVYRQCAVCYTDFWEAYEQVLPSKRHQAVGKETGKTCYIERFNNTLRQRVGRLVRKTLSFSKKLSNSLWSNLVLCASLQRLTAIMTITMHDYQLSNLPYTLSRLYFVSNTS